MAHFHGKPMKEFPHAVRVCFDDGIPRPFFNGGAQTGGPR
jgi:hypothetical protein